MAEHWEQLYRIEYNSTRTGWRQSLDYDKLYNEDEADKILSKFVGVGKRRKVLVVSEPKPTPFEHISTALSQPLLPTDAKERKRIPLASGVLDYFTSALIEVAKVSQKGNDQHNGEGTPLQWTRNKSTDHADTMLRHFVERGTVDVDGTRHSAKMAWRALAILEEELEAAGAPASRGSRFPNDEKK